MVKNKSDLIEFDKKMFEYTFKISSYIKRNHDYTKLKKIINYSLNSLILKSKNDICWKLYNKEVDENLLKMFLERDK